MIKYLIFMACIALATTPVLADDDHKGHSDDLLMLLQHKITITRLQASLPQQTTSQQTLNRQQQDEHFQQALPKLRRYIAVPESRYPNLDMYAQSLNSRAALLNDYTLLLMHFHRQVN